MNIAGCTLRAWKTAGGSCVRMMWQLAGESGVRGRPGAGARGYRGAVSPFARVVAVTAAAAVAAVAVVVGVVALQTDPVEGAAPAPKARKGAPPLTFELGVRTDPQAVALRRAEQLYAAGKRAAGGQGVRAHRLAGGSRRTGLRVAGRTARSTG